MRKFQVNTDISAPADRVWEVMADVDRWNEWTPSIRRVKRLGGMPLAVNTRVLIRQPKLPPTLWSVTVWETGRRFTWDSVAPVYA